MPKYIFSFLFVSTLFFISCDNEPLDGGFGEDINDVFDPNGDATFQVRLNETLYVAEEITAIQEEALELSGKKGNAELSINISNPTVGTYTLSNTSEELILTYVPNNTSAQTFYIATSGELTISSYNEEIGIISGTFSGTLSEFVGLGEDIQMTEGIFEDVRFIEVIEIEVPGDDELPGDGDGNGDGSGED
ncbi:DUF6252 family protein [Psychroflexus salis]|uniref:Uncharacterized protein n=1 Tax=Psychroflexus salis TaxID=1526574 RepID=A0A917E7S5_9FLAO|nr:DUF6252 family protein [Psychroflexus salis]GGE12466.1 hypothetical protein GCM10010831_12360 [Psychroflexus salis]